MITSKWISAVAALVGSIACSEAAASQPSLPGSWEWTRPSNGCAEQYVFRDDRTVSIKSGVERLERTYLIAWAAQPNGRYKVTMTTVSDSGGRGCSETVEGNPARSSSVYILFGNSGDSMIVCPSETSANCIGPLTRNKQ
jgi:hypothetical protein